VPDTGQYLIRVVEENSRPLSFGITLSPDLTGTLTAGVPLSLVLNVPGREALPTFAATAGQNIAVTMSSIATTPSGKLVYMNVYNAAGTLVSSTSSTTQATLNLTNLAAGTYSVLILPQYAATASLQLQIQ